MLFVGLLGEYCRLTPYGPPFACPGGCSEEAVGFGIGGLSLSMRCGGGMSLASDATLRSRLRLSDCLRSLS